MAIHATRAHLVRKYLRASDGTRICRLLDRLPVETLADLFGQLNERELRRIGAAVSSDEEVARTAERYDDEALLVILEAATQEDSIAMIRHMDDERGHGLIRRLDEVRAHGLLTALSAAQKPGAKSKMRNILRMRRLFA